jgi:antitoxin MazE
MKSRIVKIGNSQGIRLPKTLIEQTGLGEDIEITIEGNRLIIVPVVHPRADWAASFKHMAGMGDDDMIDGKIHTPTKWEGDEWEW